MLFRSDIEPSCSYCYYGVSIGRGEIACKNMGIMHAGGRCSAFTYEPTKREPEYMRRIDFAEMTAEDFSIT